MNYTNILLAGVASLALVSCGQKDDGVDAPKSETSQKAAKVDADSPLDSTFKLKGAEPVDIDQFFALLPEDARPTYETATFDKALGADVVTGLRFSDADDGEAITVARAEFFGLDMDAIERVKSAEDAGQDAPFETIFTKVRLYDLATEGFEGDVDNVNLTIGGVEFDQLQIRQGGTEGNGEGDEGARALNAINIAGIYYKDIAMAASSSDSPSFAVTVPDLRFVGFGGGKLNAVIANDLGYSFNQTDESRLALAQAMGPQGAMFLNGPLSGFIAPESQEIKVESFEWRDIDFSGLLSWGLRGEEPPMTAENLINLGTMKAFNAETWVNGKRAAVAAETIMPVAEFTWLVPSDVRIETKDAEYDFTAYVPDTEEETLEILKKHGLDNVEGDGIAAWVWNSKNGNASLEYAFEMPKLVDMSTNISFADLKLEELARAAEEGETNFVREQGAFKGFTLNVKDEKALDAIFDIAALQMGGSGEDLRVSAPGLIRLSGAQAAQMNPRISSYIDAVANFVGKGGALEISAVPAEPVPFTTLQSTGVTAPQTIPDVLDLTVTHKE
ncbi:hypothetical protein [Hyphococcus sp. DH-69]|uniref:hypothetical protein n=1 Tax=Hyphococcus formosus TaxID=3143534 RepID=UPI00398AEB8D